MNKLTKVKLSDVADIIGGGTPDTKKQEFWNGNIPWITPKDLSSYNYRYISNGERNITKKGLENSSARILPQGSILLTSRAPIGYIAIAQNELCTNQGFKSLILKENNCPLFFYYLLKNNIKYIINMSSGSTFPEISGSQVKNLEFNIPDLTTQEKIARVLSSLDDKIELNNKINQNLEQQAQAIFDKYIKIPCNYLKTGTIGDYCNVKSGFAFKSSWWKDSGVKVIKIKTIDNECINFTECSFVDKEKISIAEDFIVQGGDLLIAMTGATIGKFAIVPKIDEVLLVNQRVGKFFLGTHPIKKLPFLYCTLKQQDIINDIINKGQGSAQPNISSTDILDTSCYILENAELEKFNLTCEPIFEKIITNKYENEKLKQLRDTLLPKLMSGEIDVDKVEV